MCLLWRLIGKFSSISNLSCVDGFQIFWTEKTGKIGMEEELSADLWEWENACWLGLWTCANLAK
jgi:hypothetical protein